MKIVIVEKIEISNGQKERLKKLGEVIFYKDLPRPEEALTRLQEADIAIIDWTDLNPILDKLKKTKLIQLMSTAYDFIDVEKARRLGISVANIPGYATEAVAEHTFGLMISVLRKIPQANKSVRNGEWVKEPFRGSELKGKVLGIVGLGRIGSRVAEIAQAFGMKVIANDIKPKSMPDVEMVELDELLRRSDIITLHCDLNPTSENLIDESAFKLMKPSAILINTANGRVVDTQALIEALKEKKISGAGIDVLPEHPRKDHPLLQLDNVILTPEVAFNTNESLIRRVEVAIDNIESFINGKPKNVVN